jgi:hypothetical protein
MTIATGERMYADDILNLLFFPKGMILIAAMQLFPVL